MAQGSGVVIDDSGHVLTNNHVVADSQKLTVTLSDGHTYDASIAGTDPSTDLAVVTIKNAPSDLTPIALGDSESLKVGDPVMAVGNPLGLAGTVTTGIVSALNRPVTTRSAEQQQPVDPFGNPFGQQGQQQGQTSEPVVTAAIQTSAAINPGNSGGALVNGSGQLIGINSAIAALNSSGGSSQSGNIGIGFAIPVNEAKIIAEQLIKSGSAEHPYLGVTLSSGTGQDGSATVTGAKIQKVMSGTPAEKSGTQGRRPRARCRRQQRRVRRLAHRPHPCPRRGRLGQAHRPAQRLDDNGPGGPDDAPDQLTPTHLPTGFSALAPAPTTSGRGGPLLSR